MDDFHFILYILIQCLEWNKCYFYNHGSSNRKMTSVLKQGRRKISRRSFSVTLVCFSVAGNQKLYLLLNASFSEGPSIPTVVKHFISIFPGTIGLSS